jgi:alkylated DNA repair protein (DNA oxidative demethylase)
VPTIASSLPGFAYFPGYLSREEQAALLVAIEAVMAEAPLYVPTMTRSGRPMSVRMTNCGSLGWLTDKTGDYRYEPCHPVTGRPWPPIPPQLMALWHHVARYDKPPEACLINYYGPDSRLGLHRDEDERDFSAPVVSVSLGDDAVFAIGGLERQGPKRRIVLHSGDVVVMGGVARLAYHGIERIAPGTGSLIAGGGRINLTLRRVG